MFMCFLTLITRLIIFIKYIKKLLILTEIYSDLISFEIYARPFQVPILAPPIATGAI